MCVWTVNNSFGAKTENNQDAITLHNHKPTQTICMFKYSYQQIFCIIQNSKKPFRFFWLGQPCSCELCCGIISSQMLAFLQCGNQSLLQLVSFYVRICLVQTQVPQRSSIGKDRKRTLYPSLTHFWVLKLLRKCAWCPFTMQRTPDSKLVFFLWASAWKPLWCDIASAVLWFDATAKWNEKNELSLRLTD